MPTHDIIVIGAYAGDVEALRAVTRLLPPDFPAAVFIVMHFPPYGISHLPKLLAPSSRLPAAHAVDRENIQTGHLYIAPPDQHLVVRPGHVELSHGPTENRARPAIDVLFRSAAEAYNKRVVAVLLSGAVNDGISGLLEVERQGGISIVQDPEEAPFATLAQNPVLHNHLDYILPLAEIASMLDRLAREAVLDEGAAPMPDKKQQEQEKIDRDRAEQARGERSNQPALYTCPECGGNLWEVDEHGMTHFQCHVGHTLSPESLLIGKSEERERLLWSALRSTKERATLLHQMANRARQPSAAAAANFEHRMADRLEAQANATDEDARQLERFLQQMGRGTVGEALDMP